MVLPSPELLTQIEQYILQRPNKPEESKRKEHYGIFLLGYKAGLRVSEAINFNLNSETNQGLYKIAPTKKKPARYVYIPQQVISELKANNWQSQQTNRWNFYHFLKRIKQDILMKQLNISPQVELTPHSLRRCFATHWANLGMPLPLLSKLLGHKSVRTTALYWLNVHSEFEQSVKPINETADILLGKKWLEKREKRPPSIPKPLISSEPEPVLVTESSSEQSLTPETQTYPNPIKKNFSLKVNDSQEIQPLVNESVAEKTPLIEPALPEQQPISAESTNKQSEVNQPAKPNEPTQEQFLLNKISQLEEQLNQLQTENKNLKAKKEQTEALAKAEKQRTDYYEQQLKSIAKSLYQWQKLNYYQQQEKAHNQFETKIIQSLPWITNK